MAATEKLGDYANDLANYIAARLPTEEDNAVELPALILSGDYYGSNETYRESVTESRYVFLLMPDGAVRWKDTR